jgi:Ulp1 family protease
MKTGEDVGHWCLVILNLKCRRFECLDSLRDETWVDAVRFFRTMTDNIKRLWREASVDRAKPFSPMRVDDFSSEFVRVPRQENT